MKPVIVLAGGLGTRLRSVVPDLPKPMAEVAGKPFLWWILRRLEQQHATDIYLAVGYKHEMIEAYFGKRFGVMALHYVVEDEPLGTGGAIARAMEHIDDDAAYVLNGDTMAIVDLTSLGVAAEAPCVDLAMAVAPLPDVARYGAVEFDLRSHRVISLHEKGRTGAGFINAGVYLLKRATLVRHVTAERFSFEQDFLVTCLPSLTILAVPGVSQMIDIGVPKDYVLAQTCVPEMVAIDAR